VTLRCPTCRQPVDPTSKFLPFCSERCQWVDLGKWLNEEYRVPGAPVDGDGQPEDERRRSED
jgi:endogenous inhibitor of DNA gyrase (YacG/DUF329 family)